VWRKFREKNPGTNPGKNPEKKSGKQNQETKIQETKSGKKSGT